MKTPLLPIVDISNDANRQTVIAEGRANDPAGYQGHPTTVLAPDGRLICVWSIGHGGPCGPAAESRDGGRTWTRIDDRLPASYATTHRNCPTIRRIALHGGDIRLVIFSAKHDADDHRVGSNGNAPLGIVYSDDSGDSWREAPTATHLWGAMPPTGILPLKDGSVALFGQVRHNLSVETDRDIDDQDIWMSLSRDGLSWGPARIVASCPGKNLFQTPSTAHQELVETEWFDGAVHCGDRTVGGARNVLTRGVEPPHFLHFATDAGGRRVVSDYEADNGEWHLYIGEFGTFGDPASLRKILSLGSRAASPWHPHPFLSPDGRWAFFNSSASGQLQAYACDLGAEASVSSIRKRVQTTELGRSSFQ